MPSNELTRLENSEKPVLARHVRLTFDRVRGRHVLMSPESVTVLNASGAAILELCDGTRTLAEIIDALGARYDRVVDDEVRDFLARMAARRSVEVSRD